MCREAKTPSIDIPVDLIFPRAGVQDVARSAAPSRAERRNRQSSVPALPRHDAGSCCRASRSSPSPASRSAHLPGFDRESRGKPETRSAYRKTGGRRARGISAGLESPSLTADCSDRPREEPEAEPRGEQNAAQPAEHSEHDGDPPEPRAVLRERHERDESRQHRSGSARDPECRAAGL